MSRPVQFAAVIATAILFLGCGGGGGGSRSSGTTGGGTTGTSSSGQGLVSLSVSYTLPAGASMPSGGFKLSGGKFDALPASGASTKIVSWDQSRQLVALVDSNDNPYLMAFVSPSHQALTVQSTAVVLLYFGLGAYAAPIQNQEEIIEALEGDPDIATIASSLNSDLKTSGGLAQSSATYRAQVNAIAKSTLPEAFVQPSSSLKRPKSSSTFPPAAAKLDNRPPPKYSSKMSLKMGTHEKAIAVTPFNTAQSGVTVSFDAGTTISATNAAKRPVILFVDQVSTTSATGVVTPAQKFISSTAVAPAQGSAGTTDLISLLSYSLQSQSVSVPVPSSAAGISSVDYRVVAAGPGSSAGASVTLSASEQATLQQFMQTSFVKDYFLPVLNTAMANVTPSEKAQIYSQLEMAVDAKASSVQTFVASNFPNAVSQLDSGNFSAALTSVLSGLSATNTENDFAAFYNTLYTDTGNGNIDFARYQQVLGWLGKAVTGLTPGQLALPQYSDLTSGDLFDTWDVQNNTESVSITPSTASVTNTSDGQPADQVQLTANFPGLSSLPKSDTVLYSWYTAGKFGRLEVGTSPNEQYGTSFSNTNFSSAIYMSTYAFPNNASGLENVTVSLSIQDPTGKISPLGMAVASVTVGGTTRLTTLPYVVSVLPGSNSAVISAKTNSPIGADPTAGQLQWSVSPDNLGSLSAGTGLTSNNQAVFISNGTQGIATVTCSYINNATGKSTASASTTVYIQTTPTVVFGELKFGLHQFMSNGILMETGGAYVQFPIVKGYKKVVMSIYGFDDPYFYGNNFNQNSIDLVGTYNGTSWTWPGGDDIGAGFVDLGTVGANGTLSWGLAGYSGPASGTSNADLLSLNEQVSSRFAGMIVQAVYSN